MRRIIRKKIYQVASVVLAISAFSLQSLGHDAHGKQDDLILKAEQYWLSNGMQVKLEELHQSSALNAQDFSGFVFTNKDSLYNIKQGFFQRANQSALYSMSDLTSYWGQKSIWIENQFDDFMQSNHTDPEYLPKILSVMKSSSSKATQSFVSNCANVGFESGTVNWEAYVGSACYHNPESPDYTCFGFSTSSFTTGPSTDRIVTLTSGYDPIVGGTELPVVSPFGGSRSVRIENYVNGGDASKVAYDFNVTSTMPFFVYEYAVVLEDPGESHPDNAKPFFAVSIYDHTDGEFIDCAAYEVFANPEDKNFGDDNQFVDIPGNDNIKYKKWTRSVIPLDDRINHNLTISFIVSDCPWGGHLGYAYVDASCWSGDIVVGSCEGDGTRQLTAPTGFETYFWIGNEVVERLDSRNVKVRGEGPIILTMTPETGCEVRVSVEPDTCPQPPQTNCMIDVDLASISLDSCDPNSGTYNVTFNIDFTDVEDDARLYITDGQRTIRDVGPFNSTETYSFKGLYPDGKTHQIKAYIFKDDFTAYTYELCYDEESYTASNPCYQPLEPIFCDDCIGSFAPIPGEKYIVSAWVRDQSAQPTDITYTNPFIEVSFDVGTPVTLNPDGPIVEGWQRVFAEVTIPANATEISIKLSTSSGNADFDDVRVFPKDGHMKSYVYDPVSLRLVATLDENNYATYYEYDKEGNLVRSKRETSRGIVTVSENRQSNPKQ